MRKRCYSCGKVKSLIDFNMDRTKRDGHGSTCRECKNITARNNRSPKRRYKPREWTENTARYFVIYDPCNSFTDSSAFTRNEVDEMLDNEYLAIGTRFKRGKYEYRVNEKMCLKVINTAI